MNKCLICEKPVGENTGLQCHNKCEHFVHYLCLGCDNATIKGIKAGAFAVLCACKKCLFGKETQANFDDDDNDEDNSTKCFNLLPTINFKKKGKYPTEKKAFSKNCDKENEEEEEELEDEQCDNEDDESCTGTIISIDISRSVTDEKHCTKNSKKPCSNKYGRCEKCFTNEKPPPCGKSPPCQRTPPCGKSSCERPPPCQRSSPCGKSSCERPPPCQRSSPCGKSSCERPPPCQRSSPCGKSSCERPPPCQRSPPCGKSSCERPPPFQRSPPCGKSSCERPPPCQRPPSCGKSSCERPPPSKKPLCVIPISCTKHPFEKSENNSNEDLDFCEDEPYGKDKCCQCTASVTLEIELDDGEPDSKSQHHKKKEWYKTKKTKSSCKTAKKAEQQKMEKKSFHSSESAIFVRPKQTDQSLLDVLESVCHTVKQLHWQIRHLMCRVIAKD